MSNLQVAETISEVSQERWEQIFKHSYYINFDFFNNNEGQLLKAVNLLSSKEPDKEERPLRWNPKIWDHMIRKPYLERLKIAGALFLAHIDLEKFKENENNY